jgi:hypothetical protein
MTNLLAFKTQSSDILGSLIHICRLYALQIPMANDGMIVIVGWQLA